jgi:hypothetical protein
MLGVEHGGARLMTTPIDRARFARERREAALRAAGEEGLLGPRDGTVGGRVPSRLLERAKEQSGVDSVSELLVYALAKVALEDDFGPRLVARKGRVPRGTLVAD